MQKLLFTLCYFICLTSCGQSNDQNTSKKTAVQFDKCDDADAAISCSFVNIPTGINNVMKIAVSGGTPLIITGTVYKTDGKPYPGVTIYAYHTDDKGIYSKNGLEKGVQKWHGQHHGWALTNEMGRYEIRSIRPAKYPNSNAPAHIHSAVKIPGSNNAFWISDFVFKDDPDVSDKYHSSNPGGSGVVDIKLVNGVWEGVRDIKLSK